MSVGILGSGIVGQTIGAKLAERGMDAGGDHDIFVSGNDAEAKQRVSLLLKEWFGWKSVIDLGDITTARRDAPSKMDPSLGALGTPNFNFKIAR